MSDENESATAMPAGLLTGIGPKWPEGAATIRAWANGETIEGTDLVREMAAWLAYFGGAPTPPLAAIQLRDRQLSTLTGERLAELVGAGALVETWSSAAGRWIPDASAADYWYEVGCLEVVARVAPSGGES